MGRHSEYAEGVAAEIVRRYSEGATLTEIVAADGMPGLATIYRWKDCFPAFREALDRAREPHIEATVDQIQVIADTDLDPQRARNRIQVRQWRAAKLRPERYGERLDLNVNGVVSISAALLEAKARARPISDQSEGAAGQVLDVPYQILPTPADAQSSGPASDTADAAAPAPSPPSIFD